MAKEKFDRAKPGIVSEEKLSEAELEALDKVKTPKNLVRILKAKALGIPFLGPIMTDIFIKSATEKTSGDIGLGFFITMGEAVQREEAIPEETTGKTKNKKK